MSQPTSAFYKLSFAISLFLHRWSYGLSQPVEIMDSYREGLWELQFERLALVRSTLRELRHTNTLRRRSNSTFDDCDEPGRHFHKIIERACCVNISSVADHSSCGDSIGSVFSNGLTSFLVFDISGSDQLAEEIARTYSNMSMEEMKRDWKDLCPNLRVVLQLLFTILPILIFLSILSSISSFHNSSNFFSWGTPYNNHSFVMTTFASSHIGSVFTSQERQLLKNTCWFELLPHFHDHK